MANEYIISENAFENLADSVRNIIGTTNNLTVDEMAENLNNYTPSGTIEEVYLIFPTSLLNSTTLGNGEIIFVNHDGVSKVNLRTFIAPSSTEKRISVYKNSIVCFIGINLSSHIMPSVGGYDNNYSSKGTIPSFLYVTDNVTFETGNAEIE